MIQILFKVIENDKLHEQMVVKYCRQNAPKPLDEYESYCIDYSNLDFNNPTSLLESIRSVGKSIVEQQLINEPALEENKSSEDVHSVDLDDFIGRIVAVEYLATEELNDVEL